jgi:septal ring factor EnvC (AmiA/AmiB activator)
MPSGADVDPVELASQIAEITERIDEIAAQRGADADDTDAVGAHIAALDATADLVDRAHGLLTDALDRLDRV